MSAKSAKSAKYPPSDFDAWAESYDQDVSSIQEFPFAGYLAVLSTIYRFADAKRGEAVLDLGIGTGNLAALFVEQGCKVWGLDFSTEMLAKAHSKLPGVILGEADLSAEWPVAFRRKFDCIVSAYTLHHFVLNEKVALVRRLMDEHLEEQGRLIIGDIAFEDSAAEDELRQSLGTEWEQEEYWLADSTAKAFRRAGIAAEFSKISECAGVFRFRLLENQAHTSQG